MLLALQGLRSGCAQAAVILHPSRLMVSPHARETIVQSFRWGLVVPSVCLDAGFLLPGHSLKVARAQPEAGASITWWSLIYMTLAVCFHGNSTDTDKLACSNWLPNYTPGQTQSSLATPGTLKSEVPEL
jgi:hypothetical protein